MVLVLIVDLALSEVTAMAFADMVKEIQAYHRRLALFVESRFSTPAT